MSCELVKNLYIFEAGIELVGLWVEVIYARCDFLIVYGRFVKRVGSNWVCLVGFILSLLLYLGLFGLGIMFVFGVVRVR